MLFSESQPSTRTLSTREYIYYIGNAWLATFEFLLYTIVTTAEMAARRIEVVVVVCYFRWYDHIDLIFF